MAETMARFEIHVPDDVLDDLRSRLDRIRFPDQLDETGWDYGTERSYLEELCAYWRDGFDWRKQEALLNSFDHFKTDVDGLGVHFVHQRSRVESALPLVITHGWPGSIFEFYKIIGPLTDPEAHGGSAEDAFHVVCPSIPGYGFSDKPSKPGFHPKAAAEVNAKLMSKLGYALYGVQGGDWGSVISSWNAVVDRNHVCGVHLNMPLAQRPDGSDPKAELDPESLRRLLEGRAYRQTETGYFAIQSTKPQTLGYGLNDSPAGLAAWIVEKFRRWSDCNGAVEERFTKDELLTNITIYWATETITSSSRLYFEARAAGHNGPPDEFVSAPTACAVFPKEIGHAPRPWVEKHFNVTRWTEFPRGGHFAALEEPELLVGDIREFFRGSREKTL